jgi:hypothetical protein
MVYKGWSRLLVTSLLFVFSSGVRGQESRRANADGISTTIAVANDGVLPFESVDLMIALQNETSETKRVVAAWRSSIDIGEVKAGGVVQWRNYKQHNRPVVSPPRPSARTFAPGETKKFFVHLDYEEPAGAHAFARPGKYRLRAVVSYDRRFISNEFEFVVGEPRGPDARAYEFLQKSDVHRYFSEHGVSRYPRTRSNVRALERFIVAFDGSEYSSLARVGLALMWRQGVDGHTDLLKAKTLLTRVAQRANDPVAARASYYLGLMWREQGDAARAKEAFQAVLRSERDAYFVYLAEQALKNTK